MLFVSPNVKISKYWFVKFDFTANTSVKISSMGTGSVIGGDKYVLLDIIVIQENG